MPFPGDQPEEDGGAPGALEQRRRYVTARSSPPSETTKRSHGRLHAAVIVRRRNVTVKGETGLSRLGKEGRPAEASCALRVRGAPRGTCRMFVRLWGRESCPADVEKCQLLSASSWHPLEKGCFVVPECRRFCSPVNTLVQVLQPGRKLRVVHHRGVAACDREAVFLAR